MSEKARNLLRKLRSERSRIKNLSYSSEKTTKIENKFIFNLKEVNNQKEEKKELDPLTFFEKNSLKIIPMNVKEYLYHSDNENEEEIIQKIPLKKMRTRLVNNQII